VGCAREDLAELVLGGPRGDVALGDGGAAGKPAVASRNCNLRGARRERRERRASGNVEPQLDVRRRQSPRRPIIHWIVSEKSRSDTEVTEHTEIESPGIHDHGEAITTWRSTQLRAGGYPRTKAGPSSADRSLRTAANVRVQYRPCPVPPFQYRPFQSGARASWGGNAPGAVLCQPLPRLHLATHRAASLATRRISPSRTASAFPAP